MRVSLAVGGVVIALVLRVPLVPRLVRNVLTPAMPRAVEPRYPLVEDVRLAEDITVVVGTKDAVTCSLDQLRHLAQALPSGIRVIYTYPTPLWDDAEAHESLLREAAGRLGGQLTLLPVDSFSNPFSAWLAAAPHIGTKYTLLMHNDVFFLDARSHFLSELHGALEQHPDTAVAAPQIYETETKGLLTTHLFNTNLHLRTDASGVAFMSHEVDLLTGLSREPGDFTQRVNRHFLEDHVFLTKTVPTRGAGRMLPPASASSALSLPCARPPSFLHPALPAAPDHLPQAGSTSPTHPHLAHGRRS